MRNDLDSLRGDIFAALRIQIILIFINQLLSGSYQFKRHAIYAVNQLVHQHFDDIEILAPPPAPPSRNKFPPRKPSTSATSRDGLVCPSITLRPAWYSEEEGRCLRVCDMLEYNVSVHTANFYPCPNSIRLVFRVTSDQRSHLGKVISRDIFWHFLALCVDVWLTCCLSGSEDS